MDMTTAPSKNESLTDNELPKPYTDSTKQYNIKPRAVQCNFCKYVIVTDLPGPRCGTCNSFLVTSLEGYELVR